MRIQRITFEMGNDFHAVMECEHCGGTQENKSGYHDNYYHTRVIPEMACQSCGLRRDGHDPRADEPPHAHCVECGCEVHPSEKLCGECQCEEDDL